MKTLPTTAAKCADQALAMLGPMILGFALTILAVASAAAQSYPTKPIRIISPFSAGSTPDALGRLVGQQLSERLGQNVTVENRPGAGTTIATKAVATSDPDGYTLLQGGSALAYSDLLYPNAGYDPSKSFVGVAPIAAWSHVLVVPASVPANNLQELVAYAKAHPGQLNIGFPLGQAPQVLTELLKSSSGAPFNSVPYRQLPQLSADFLAGRIQGWFGAGAGLVSLVQQGKAKAIAFTGVTRSALLPSVPTVIESGLPQLALNPSDWTGILAPAGTPSIVIDTLNAAINASINSPELKSSIAQQGSEAKATSPSDFAAFLVAETKKWPPLVKAAGMKPE